MEFQQLNKEENIPKRKQQKQKKKQKGMLNAKALTLVSEINW